MEHSVHGWSDRAGRDEPASVEIILGNRAESKNSEKRSNFGAEGGYIVFESQWRLHCPCIQQLMVAHCVGL
jgi:hypothetical protein